jgi:hypothetical protein
MSAGSFGGLIINTCTIGIISVPAGYVTDTFIGLANKATLSQTAYDTIHYMGLGLMAFPFLFLLAGILNHVITTNNESYGDVGTSSYEMIVWGLTCIITNISLTALAYAGDMAMTPIMRVYSQMYAGGPLMAPDYLTWLMFAVILLAWIAVVVALFFRIIFRTVYGVTYGSGI